MGASIRSLANRYGLDEYTVFDLLHNGWDFEETHDEPARFVQRGPDKGGYIRNVFEEKDDD